MKNKIDEQLNNNKNNSWWTDKNKILINRSGPMVQQSSMQQYLQRLSEILGETGVTVWKFKFFYYGFQF